MTLILTINGAEYTAWKSVSVDRSLGNGARTFRVAAANIPNPVWPIDDAPTCEIHLNNILVLRGSIEDDQAQIDEATHGRQLSGRSLTGDVIDSSVNLPGNEIKGRTLDEIIRQAAAPHGVSVTIDGDPGAPFDAVRPFQGETVFSLADRLARHRGFLPTATAEGNLHLFRASLAAGGHKLIEGQNIKGLRRTRKMAQRFSEYVVRGQKPGTEQAYGRNASVEAVLRDPGVPRYRRLAIVMEEPGDIQAARDRADWEAARRAADSLTAGGRVVGWERAPGVLWEPGDVVQLVSPSLQVNRTMLVDAVKSTLDDSSGEVTDLTFAVPESATPEAATSVRQTGAVSGATGASPAAADGFTVSDIWTTAKPAGRAQ
ncbi:MAG: phage baseplate assembly protein [Pseudomonadota bacterium]